MKLEGKWIFSNRPLRVETTGRRISRVEEIAETEGMPYLAPGFADLQVNGYRGIDYSSPELKEDDVEELVTMLAVSGTTQHVPTIVTNPRETIVRNLAVLSRVRKRLPETASAILGYHIEGPFISPIDGPRGAHSSNYVREPDFEEFLEWQDAADGKICIVTVAPEIPGAIDFIREVAQTGVLVSIGHSGAPPEIVRSAVDAGAKLSTHLGNGSHATIPRLKNYIWEQLAADELSAGLITDGFHLPGSVVKTFTRAKGLERLFLVSDVAVHGGKSPGVYPWGDITCEVFPDGHLGLYGSPPFLAGAGHLLDWDIAHFVGASGLSLRDAIRLCTTRPRTLLGIEAEETLTEGQEANLVTLDFRERDERVTIGKTVQAGRLLFENEARV